MEWSRPTLAALVCCAMFLPRTAASVGEPGVRSGQCGRVRGVGKLFECVSVRELLARTQDLLARNLHALGVGRRAGPHTARAPRAAAAAARRPSRRRRRRASSAGLREGLVTGPSSAVRLGAEVLHVVEEARQDGLVERERAAGPGRRRCSARPCSRSGWRSRRAAASTGRRHRRSRPRSPGTAPQLASRSGSKVLVAVDMSSSCMQIDLTCAQQSGG